MRFTVSNLKIKAGLCGKNLKILINKIAEIITEIQV